MKAVTCLQYGGPEVLQFTEIPVPTPKPDEVLIKVKSTTVSAADVRVRAFKVPPAFRLIGRLMLGWKKPRRAVLGAEVSGIITAVGAEVSNFKAGEAVFGLALPVFGAYAEYVCLKSTALAHKPSHLSFEAAAAIPIGACTALRYLQKAKLKAGDKILIYGASGSVGTYATQLAAYFGAEVTTVSSSKRFALLKSLGATKLLDYTDPNYYKQLETYQVIFVAIDQLPFVVVKEHLASNGRYINIVNPLKSFAMRWSAWTSDQRYFMSEPAGGMEAHLPFLQRLVEEGQLQVVIDRRYPLEDIQAAHQYVDLGHKMGNVTITVSSTS